jgi:hypothetical protein
MAYPEHSGGLDVAVETKEEIRVPAATLLGDAPVKTDMLETGNTR